MEEELKSTYYYMLTSTATINCRVALKHLARPVAITRPSLLSTSYRRMHSLH
jgi:hypothetical protein